MYSDNMRDTDIVDIMDALTPTAVNLFKMIKDKLDYKTNEARLRETPEYLLMFRKTLIAQT